MWWPASSSAWGALLSFKLQWMYGTPLLNPEEVDQLFSALVRGQSAMTCLITWFAVGGEAMMRFAEHFPSIEYLQFGTVDCPYEITPAFALACERALPSLSHSTYTLEMLLESSTSVWELRAVMHVPTRNKEGLLPGLL